LSDRPPSPVNPPQQSPIASVNELFYEERSFGQRAADAVTEFVGSWQFIIVQSIALVLWVALNTAALIAHWDPYPFIFMNLLVSLESALASPMILMSQNRQADRDRAIARNEFVLTIKAEAEVRAVLAQLTAQDKAIAELRELLIALQTGAAREAASGTSSGSAPTAGAGGERG
jgi:uncharacterized membrane protein